MLPDSNSVYHPGPVLRPEDEFGSHTHTHYMNQRSVYLSAKSFMLSSLITACIRVLLASCANSAVIAFSGLLLTVSDCK